MASNGGHERPTGDQPQGKRAKAEGAERVSFEEVVGRISNTVVVDKAPECPFIATHHGTFHADEAAACAMLKCLPEYAGMPIVRTRNPADIDKAAIVVDVGAVCDPSNHRYDHHQKTFTETYSDEYPDIKLSSAGLVFKHFGKRIVGVLCAPIESKPASVILAKTYETIIRELDALDNGVSVAENPRYRFVSHLGARVGRLNPSWQEKSTPELENSRFKEAMKIAAKEVTDIIGGYYNGWLPARVIVEEGLSKRFDLHPSGEIMKLPNFCPWQEHLFDLESENEKSGNPLVKYVLFSDSRAGWRIQAVPKERGSFANRLPLPKAWCGIRDQALSDLTGIPGCVFVHAAGFIGGNSTEAGAFEMARKALEENAKA